MLDRPCLRGLYLQGRPLVARRASGKEVPGYTYAVGAACTLLMALTIALLQQGLGVESIGAALGLGAMIAVGLVIANIVPGQAFLKRWRVAAICAGSQTVMVLSMSTILGLWRS